jgi:nucleotide-binding universal stress UspA family protein
MTIRSDFIVAGVDGSEAALDAARWAAAEADRRHCELRLVHAYAVPATLGYPDYATYPDELAPIMREEGERVVGRLAVELRDTHPDLAVTTRVLEQHPVLALRSESEHALLTVVGSDHAGRFNSVLLGSVALAIASTNTAPVAVIHAGQTQRDSGPVVVGVDGTHTSDAAIAFAFGEASVRGADLVAVLAWNDLSVPVTHRMKDLMDPARIEQEERALLAERTAGWADKFPDVRVVRTLVEGRAVGALLDHSGDAQLLVVGSHGRGGFTGMLLGSTSHSLIIHSTCPVVVVRPGTD